MTSAGGGCLALRLAGPLQSWGSASQFNRRETSLRPTKSGVLGLLAAADGRRRSDPIEDLLGLRFGVRVDQAGSVLRDYHTVSDPAGLRTATVVEKTGLQKRKPDRTAVTERYYLQDAVFVAVLAGDEGLLEQLRQVVRRPAFPLALGRRACAPTQPLVIEPSQGMLWVGALTEVLAAIPWQAFATERRRASAAATVRLETVADDDAGADIREDVPRSFDHHHLGYTRRRISYGIVEVPTGSVGSAGRQVEHDPFALLGW